MAGASDASGGLHHLSTAGAGKIQGKFSGGIGLCLHMPWSRQARPDLDAVGFFRGRYVFFGFWHGGGSLGYWTLPAMAASSKGNE